MTKQSLHYGFGFCIGSKYPLRTLVLKPGATPVQTLRLTILNVLPENQTRVIGALSLCNNKVDKVLTARENPGGIPGWAILPEMVILGNKIFSPIFIMKYFKTACLVHTGQCLRRIAGGNVGLT